MLEARNLPPRYRTRAVQALEEGLRMVPAEQRSSFWRDKMAPRAIGVKAVFSNSSFVQSVQY